MNRLEGSCVPSQALRSGFSEAYELRQTGNGLPAREPFRLNRTDLQQLAEDRVIDAKVLLDAGRWSGAYYVAGYAIECALKSCLAKRTNLHDFPDRALAQKAFTHDLQELLESA